MSFTAPVPIAAPIDELRAWLRAPAGDASPADSADASALNAALAAASEQVEAATGLALVQRTITETRGVTGGWQRLDARPVVAITLVERVRGDGSTEPIPSASYAVEIDDRRAGWLRVPDTSVAGRVRVTLLAGLAESAADLPAALRQAVVLQAAALLARRNGAEGSSALDPQAEALLAPWRGVRL